MKQVKKWPIYSVFVGLGIVIFSLFQNFTSAVHPDFEQQLEEVKVFSLINDLRPEVGVVKSIAAINGNSPSESRETGWLPYEIQEEKDLCDLSYTMVAGNAQPQLSMQTVPSSILKRGTQVYDKYYRKGWGIGNWHSEFALCDKRYQKLSIYNYGFDFGAWPNPAATTNPGTNSVLINKDFVKLNLRSVDHYKHYFGCSAYGNEKHKDFPELLLQNIFAEDLPVGKAKQIVMEVASVFSWIGNIYSKLVTDCGWAFPDGGGWRYNSGKHAAEYRVAFEVIWNDTKICPKWTEECSKKLGQRIHVLIPLYDDRTNGGYVAGSVMFDQGTQHWMYKIPLADLHKVALPGSSPITGWNPFAVWVPGAVYSTLPDSKYAKLNVDLLPFIKKSIIQAVNSGKGLPPRELLPSGQPESDEEYINHFVIKAVNFGFEAPGLSHLSLLIKKFDLKYTRVVE